VRVLITGAGQVGCHAAAALSAGGHECVLLDVHPDRPYVWEVAGKGTTLLKESVNDTAVVTRLLERERVDAVVHTAALIGHKAERNPALAFYVNTQGTASVADACCRASVRRLVHVSSLGVYDWAALAGAPWVSEDGPIRPRTVYSASKLAAEAAALAFEPQGLAVTLLRLAGVYGHGHYRGGSRVGFLLRRSLERALAGQEVRLPASLGASEHLYAPDAGHAVRAALERGLPGTFNIGTGVVSQAEEVADAIRAAVPGADVAAPPPEPAPPPLDIRRAARALGYRARWSLPDGMADWAELMRAAAREEVTQP